MCLGSINVELAPRMGVEEEVAECGVHDMEIGSTQVFPIQCNLDDRLKGIQNGHEVFMGYANDFHVSHVKVDGPQAYDRLQYAWCFWKPKASLI